MADARHGVTAPPGAGGCAGAAGASRRPGWVRARMPGSAPFRETLDILRGLRLHTVCQSARCPNIGECFRARTATFMIMGDACTRRCAFCGVTETGGRPGPLDPSEPGRLAEAVRALELDHVVITSVTRDDLPDGGAGHFARCAAAAKEARPDARIEVLVPDFGGRADLVQAVAESPIDVLNHNLETVPRLYASVRPGAGYWRSLTLLARAARSRDGLWTKSGLMLGLGESREEVRRTMLDLREAGCGLLTLGQYLQPTPRQTPVVRHVPPEEFAQLRIEALAMGFRGAHCGPLVRSSYHAREQTPA